MDPEVRDGLVAVGVVLVALVIGVACAWLGAGQ